MSAFLRRLAPHAAALAFFALLAVGHTRLWNRVGTDLYAHIDPLQDAWILVNVTDNLWHRPAELFEGNNYFPSRDAVLFCDPLMLPALLVAPLRFFGASPALLYNAALLGVLTLAGYGFWRLAVHLSGDAWAALLAGAAIPYTPQLFSHVYQLNLLTSAGYPFLLLGLLRLIERPSWGAALLTGAAFGLQAGTSGYHAFACAFLGLIVAAWGWRSLLSREGVARAGTAAGVAALFLAPYVIGHLRHRGEADLARPLHWAQAWSLDLATGLFSSHTYAWRWLMPDHGMPVWPGLVVLTLGIAGAWRVRSTQARLLLIVIAVFFVLALGPELRVAGVTLVPMPYLALNKALPFFAAARRAGFFIVPAMMALGLLAVLGMRSFALTRRRGVVLGIVALATLESAAPAFARRDPGRTLPDVYVFLEAQAPGAVLELPAEDDDNMHYQWWSNWHRRPLANGVTALEPRWSQSLLQLIRREWKRKPASQDMSGWASTQSLQALPIRYLIVHPGASGYLATHVEATPAVFRRLHTAVGGERVYAISRGARLDRPVRRRFRDDQLAEPLRLRLRADGEATLALSVNEGATHTLPVADGEHELTYAVPPAEVRRGLNTIAFEPVPGVELVALEP